MNNVNLSSEHTKMKKSLSLKQYIVVYFKIKTSREENKTTYYFTISSSQCSASLTETTTMLSSLGAVLDHKVGTGNRPIIDKEGDSA